MIFHSSSRIRTTINEPFKISVQFREFCKTDRYFITRYAQECLDMGMYLWFYGNRYDLNQADLEYKPTSFVRLKIKRDKLDEIHRILGNHADFHTVNQLIMWGHKHIQSHQNGASNAQKTMDM